MTENQVKEVMEHLHPYLPELSALSLNSKLEKANPECLDDLMSIRMKSRTATILLSVFLGSIGVARFYLRDIFIAIWRIIVTILPLLSAYITVNYCPAIDDCWFALTIITSVAAFAWYIADIFWAAARAQYVNLNTVNRFLATEKYKRNSL